MGARKRVGIGLRIRIHLIRIRIRFQPLLKSLQLSKENIKTWNISIFSTLWVIFALLDPDSSVADPGCLSRIPDPDFYPSRIPDPKTPTKERGENKFDVTPFYVATNLSAEEKIWANFQRIIELFAQKIVTKLSKVWVWDPGPGKNLFRIPDPGVKKAPDPDPQHCRILNTDPDPLTRLNPDQI